MGDVLKKAFVIRDLKPSDGKTLIENYYSYYKELSENPNFGVLLFKTRPSYKDELGWFRSLLRKVREGRAIASVAEVDGKVVGICEVSYDQGKENEHIGDLGIAVIKARRGQGIGEALMAATIKKCGRRLEILRLAVFANNTGAKRLYRRLGFRRYGYFRNGIKRDGRYIDEEFMYLDLRRF